MDWKVLFGFSRLKAKIFVISLSKDKLIIEFHKLQLLFQIFLSDKPKSGIASNLFLALGCHLVALHKQVALFLIKSKISNDLFHIF